MLFYKDHVHLSLLIIILFRFLRGRNPGLRNIYMWILGLIDKSYVSLYRLVSVPPKRQKNGEEKYGCIKT